MPAKFSLLTVAALPLIPVALACGGDDGPTSVRIDARVIDTAPVECTASSMYGDVPAGSNTQGADIQGTHGGTGMDRYRIEWFGRNDPSTPPDIIELLLFESGPFNGGITPQTVQLTGDNTDLSTCSACALILTDLHKNGTSLEYTDIYFVRSGTLNLTSTVDTLEGTITNATFTHVMPAGQSLVSAGDGCDVTVPTTTINAVIMTGSGSGSGSATGKPLTASDRLEMIQNSIQHRTF